MRKKARLILSLLFLCATLNVSAKDLTTQEIKDIIVKVNNHWQKNHSPQERSFWDPAVYHTGNMEAYALIGDTKWLRYSEQWADYNKWMGASETDKSKWRYKEYGEDPQHVLFGDWQTCFQTFIDLYNISPEPYKVARAKEVMNYVATSSDVDYWFWSDALYMVMPVMVKMYKLTGDNAYLDKMWRCWSYANSIMWDDKEGLYYRDAKYVYPGHTTASGKKDFWARGNGWVVAAFAKVLKDLPYDDIHRTTYIDYYKRMADAVVACQQTQGFWSRSMLDESQAPGYETSGTALIVYGLQWGVNNGILSKEKYQATIDRAWSYLVDVALQNDGSIGYVQPIGERAIPGQIVDRNSTANFGTGAFLLAACEYYRKVSAQTLAVTDKRLKVTIENNQDLMRWQLVELSADDVFGKLGVAKGKTVRVLNARGQEVPWQLTYDGKFLIEATVMPLGKSTFTIVAGTPKNFPKQVTGRLVPERKDDFSWENDRSAYRSYGPALQQSGEKAYGNDIWSKNTPSFVADKWYAADVDAWKQIHREGITERSKIDSIFLEISFHLDHGEGLDCYAVGPSLGCGTPALLHNDSILFPYCWRTYDILDEGPLRFTVHLTYEPKTIGADKNVIENRIISLDKGSNFNKCIVWYDGMSQNYDVCSGVVVHSADTKHVLIDKNYVLYADPTDNADNNFQLFVGALFPDVSQTTFLKNTKKSSDIAGHVVGIKRQQLPTKSFTYYFGSAWSKYDCRSFEEWQIRGEQTFMALTHPLITELKVEKF